MPAAVRVLKSMRMLGYTPDRCECKDPSTDRQAMCEKEGFLLHRKLSMRMMGYTPDRCACKESSTEADNLNYVLGRFILLWQVNVGLCFQRRRI
jgi:hypothetical protein